jgi:hypothetical protein
MKSKQELNPESLRNALKGASLQLDEIKAKLCNNESRLVAIEEGKQESRVLWDEARESADRTLALVTAVEVGVRTFEMDGSGGTSIEQPLMAMPGFTGAELQEIASRGESAQFGAINMMQGYLGEERALNAINSGAVPVPDGRYATLAESSNQTGYDLVLLSENGAPSLTAQVKISDSGAIIREHFERYPDVSIVYTNSEAATSLLNDPNITVLQPGDAFPNEAGHFVVDMGFAKDEIRSSAVSIMDGADGISLGDQIQNNIPWIALLAIAGRAAYEFVDTDTNVNQILRAAGKRVRQSMLASGTSTLTTVATTEPLLGTVAGVTTLFGGRAVSQAREDVQYATSRLQRMAALLRNIRMSQPGWSRA